MCLLLFALNYCLPVSTTVCPQPNTAGIFFFNAGQVCCAGSRLLVSEDVADQLVDKIKRRMGTLRVGDSLDKCSDMGAVVDPIQVCSSTVCPQLFALNCLPSTINCLPSTNPSWS